MTERERQALATLIAYNIDEEIDYENQDEQGRRLHILNDILILQNYLHSLRVEECINQEES